MYLGMGCSSTYSHNKIISTGKYIYTKKKIDGDKYCRENV